MLPSIRQKAPDGIVWLWQNCPLEWAISQMNLLLDNRTQTVVQVVVSLMLCIVMGIAWHT